ncbi:hypothetical protein [Sanguibacter suaedae]|uniref:Uncharacterized protein n=1 Tax=Sanguibacter suaedae TaxID=2795737 RepID=A0A934I728_9MICO|nr:hypothetical protein [Sanguibacter suaedae]MBI9113405.1 hypothetical protein [Sanguibacter suaedae]
MAWLPATEVASLLRRGVPRVVTPIGVLVVHEKTVRRVTSVILGLEALYVVGLVVVVGGFAASMRAFDGEPQPQLSGVVTVVGLLSGLVLASAAIVVMKGSFDPGRQPDTASWVLWVALVVNVGLAVGALVSALWLLLGVSLTVSCILGAQLGRPRHVL